MAKIVVSEETLLLQLPGVAATIHLRITQPASPSSTLVFVPDFAGTCRDFDESARFFATQDIRAVSFDMPGRGQSAYLSPELYRIRVFMRVIASVLERFPGHPITLFGSGWGAMMALAFAASLKARHPRLVLADVRVTVSGAAVVGFGWFHPWAGRRSARRAAAAAAAADGPAIRSLPEKARAHMAHHRVGRSGGGFRLQVDPALDAGLDPFRKQVFDLGALAPAIPSWLMFCQTDDGWRALGERLGNPGLVFVEQTGAKSHCGLIDPGDRLALLGYIAARELGPLEREPASDAAGES